MCSYLLKYARYLSLRHPHSVPYLCVLKFSTPLVSRPALSAVPARYAFIVQPYLSYILLFKGCNRYIKSARAMREVRAIYA
jgi:hypothetical protein